MTYDDHLYHDRVEGGCGKHAKDCWCIEIGWGRWDDDLQCTCPEPTPEQWCHFHQRPRQECSEIIAAGLARACRERDIIESVNRTGTKGTEHPLGRTGGPLGAFRPRSWMDWTFGALSRAYRAVFGKGQG